LNLCKDKKSGIGRFFYLYLDEMPVVSTLLDRVLFMAILPPSFPGIHNDCSTIWAAVSWLSNHSGHEAMSVGFFQAF